MVLAMPCADASKLSHFFKKMDAQEKSHEARDKAKKEQEMKEDLNFGDYAYRLDKRFTNDKGFACREYALRSKSNPFKNGRFEVCDEH